jgi:hypothetical protein
MVLIVILACAALLALYVAIRCAGLVLAFAIRHPWISAALAMGVALGAAARP